MSTPPTERQVEKQVQELREQLAERDTTDGDITVLWGTADPSNRPEGVTWIPETGTLTYDLWDAQRDCLATLRERETDVVGMLAGYGSGKTMFGARWLIKNALEHDGSRFLGMGIDFTKARDTTFRVLFEQLPGERTGIVTSSYNGPESSPIVADYNRQNHRLTLTNDTVIKLGSADKWNRYAGDEYGGVWLDEPSHYGEDLHDLLEMIGSRLRGVSGPKTQLWTLTGNGYNAAYEILEKQEDSDGEDLGLGIQQVRASTLDNPYLDESDKERFTRQYGDTAREDQALHGGFAAAQGLVYSNFSRDTHVIDHSEALDRLEADFRIYGYDAGWNDPRILLEIGRTDYEQYVVLDEYHESGTHVDDAIAWLKQNDKPRGTVYCEHNPGDIDKFSGTGYRPEKAEKALDGGIDEVRKHFEADDDGRPGLLISENCEHLINELQGYKEEHVGTSQAVDHCADGLRYAIFTHEQTSKKTGAWTTVKSDGGSRGSPFTL